YIKACRINNGSEVVTVYTPQFIVGHWWENLLHNHKARRIRHKLMLVHGVMLALVPWLLDSSDLIYGRRSRPLPGQDRRGEPRRPVQRRAMPPADLKAAREAARAARNDEPMRGPSAAVGGVKSAASKTTTKPSSKG
ncbi:MAG TPA: DNA-binding protein, partial [Pseudolysinimonas sp.]